MRKTLIRLSGALLVAAALQCAPAYAATHVYVRIAPPVAVVETPSPSVHPGWVWRPGYHRWVRHRYEWVRGAWIAPPRGRRTWNGWPLGARAPRILLGRRALGPLTVFFLPMGQRVLIGRTSPAATRLHDI